jgi:hypothetical protein
LIAFRETVGYFVADDGAEVGIGVFLAVAVAAAAVLEIRAVADVALVFVGPADKAVITIFRFQSQSGGSEVIPGRVSP